MPKDEAFEKALVLIHVLKPVYFILFFNKQIAITNLSNIKLKHVFKNFPHELSCFASSKLKKIIKIIKKNFLEMEPKEAKELRPGTLPRSRVC